MQAVCPPVNEEEFMLPIDSFELGSLACPLFHFDKLVGQLVNFFKWVAVVGLSVCLSVCLLWSSLFVRLTCPLLLQKGKEKNVDAVDSVADDVFDLVFRRYE